jgi:hypothetical protein
VDTRTKYALFYSTCSVNSFRNGSIIADFVLGFTRYQNVTRLNYFLNRTLVNQVLFGGTILSIAFNLSLLNSDNSSIDSNSTGDYDNSGDYDDDSDDDDVDGVGDDEDSTNFGKFIMTEQNLANDQLEPTRTTYTTVTYTKLDKGLSITISETITITTNNNNSLDKSPIHNKNYEVLLAPTIDNAKTIVIPPDDTNEKSLLPSPQPLTTAATNVVTKSPTQDNLLRPIKPINNPNFAYIDESSDDRTFSSGDGII